MASGNIFVSFLGCAALIPRNRPSTHNAAAARPRFASRFANLSYVYDVVTQRLSGQRYYFVDGQVQPSPTEMRYAWPAELDLMVRLAGMRLQDRWAGWGREPFTALSASHVSVYAKP